MGKEGKFEEENILNPDNDEVIISDGIDLIPYQSLIVGDAVAVGHGPDPILIGNISSIENDDVIFTDFGDTIMVDVDSDMYGGPLPEGFLTEETDMSNSSVESEFLYVDDIDSEDESRDEKSNNNGDVNDYYI